MSRLSVGFILMLCHGCVTSQHENAAAKEVVTVTFFNAELASGEIGFFRVLLDETGSQSCWFLDEGDSCNLVRGDLSEQQIALIRKALLDSASRVPFVSPHSHSPVCEAAWRGRTESLQLIDERDCVFSAEVFCKVAGDVIGIDIARPSVSELPLCVENT